jgi:hypothetical protein
MYNVSIDLKGVQTTEDIFDRFQEVFQFAYYDKELDSAWNERGYLNPDSETYKDLQTMAKRKGVRRNWDSMNDSFLHLDSDSMLYKKMIAPQKDIHLIVKNINDVKKVPTTKGLLLDNEYLTLIDLLACATDKKGRSGSKGDDVNFTFEIMNDE